MSFRTYNRNLRYLLRTITNLCPPLYNRVARGRQNAGKQLWNEDCELVIEGFPRSGNSFAVRAFRSVQKRDVVLAHHFHSSSQVLTAARRDRPVLVLVRPPGEAVASLLVRDPDLWPSLALLEYILFHLAVLRCRNKIVVGEFSQVVSNLGAVIEAVNRHYGTAFQIYRNDDVRDGKILEESFLENRRLNKARDHVADMVSAPSTDKAVKKKDVSKRYERFPNRFLLKYAQTCYERMLQ